jgi:hypothetical protein
MPAIKFATPLYCFLQLPGCPDETVDGAIITVADKQLMISSTILWL